MSHEVVDVTPHKIVLRGRLGLHEVQYSGKEIDDPSILQVLNTLGVTMKEVRAVQLKGN